MHCTVSNEVMRGSAGYEGVRKCVVFISIRHHVGLHQFRKAHSPEFSSWNYISFCRDRYASRTCGPSKSISAADACSSPTATSMACQTFALIERAHAKLCLLWHCTCKGGERLNEDLERWKGNLETIWRLRWNLGEVIWTQADWNSA